MTPLALLVALLVVATLPASGLGAPAQVAPDGTGSADGARALDGPSVVLQRDGGNATESGSNESVRHQDPDRSDEAGDTDALRRSLAAQLSTRLAESAVRVDRGDYERARSLVGDDYNRTLARYVEVVGPRSTDDSPEAYREAGANQREFTRSVDAYWATYDAYREAKVRGDPARAREFARDLEQSTTEVSQHGDELKRNYETLAPGGSPELNDSLSAVNEAQRNVTTRQAAVVGDEFVATSLTVRGAGTDASFRDPLRLTGRLTAANGTPLSNRAVAFRIEDQRYEAETDDRGAFSFDYRPTTLPLGPGSVTVSYAPRVDSVYLASNATTPITVAQVAPDVTIQEGPERAAYGEQVVVSGRVAVDDVPAAGVPIAVRAGGVGLGTAVTDETGTYRLRTPLPAAVPDGDQVLVARIAQQDRALAPAEAAASIPVEPTTTDLTFSARLLDEETLHVSGGLRTDDGRPLPDQPIDLRVDDSLVETVRTDADGRYDATLSSPGDAGTARNVSASFDGSGTNLASARDGRAFRQRAVASAPPGGLAGELLGLWTAVATALGVAPDVVDARLAALAMVTAVGLLIGGGLYTGGAFTRSRRRGPRVTDVRKPLDGSGGVTRPTPDLSASREHLARGDTDRAVVEAYAMARADLSTRTGVPNRGTSGAFFAALVAADPPTDLGSFRRLTHLYEFAEFAARDASEADAEAALELALDVVDPDDRAE